MTCAGLSSSPAAAAAAPLEDENLLPEILLRLAPLPSSLPRASLVCARWRRLVTDPDFIRRFRAHHRRRPPPLLGFFEDRLTTARLPPDALHRLSFNPIPDPPDRLPVHRFSKYFAGLRMVFGCRDGLVLMLKAARHGDEVLVWDPVTRDQHCFAVPRVLHDHDGKEVLNGAVLRTAGVHDDRPFRFQVVMVGIDWKNRRLSAGVYSSETGKWGDPVFASVDSVDTPSILSMRVSSTMVGNSLYWKLDGSIAGMLEFDLDRQILAVIPLQLNAHSDGSRSFRAMRAESGELGILELLGFNIQLWKRKIDYDGVGSWVLTKTIELDQLLSLDKEQMRPKMLGYCEDNNVVFLWTVLGVFMLHIESMKFSKLDMESFFCFIHPFTSVYIPGMGIGGGHDVAKLLHDAYGDCLVR